MKGWRSAITVLLATGIAACSWACAQIAPAPRPAAAARTSCFPRTAPLSEAEAALSREQYDMALDLYSKMAGGSAQEQDLGRAGVIRTMLGQDKVAEARGLADAWVAEQPKKPLALETQSEAMFRAGNLLQAYRTNQSAFELDHCLARVYLMDAAYEDLSAFFALSKRHIDTARKLDAIDPEIRRAWASYLPKTQRLEEWAALARDDRMLNEKQRHRLSEAVAHAGDSSSKDCSVVEAGDVTQPAGETIPIQPILDGPNRLEGLALDVRFNGKRRRLEIDTGASGLVLSRGAASGLGLTRERQVEAGGIGDKGNVTTSIAHVASVKIGNLEFRNCAVEILEKRSALDIDGLIGGNVFSKYLLTLDFPKLQLRLNTMPPRPDQQQAGQQKPKPEGLQTVQAKAPGDGIEGGDSEEPTPHDRYVAPEMKDWTPIYRNGHHLLIPVHVGEAQEHLFIVDTGAGTMLISPEAAREVTKVRKNDAIGIRGISGEVEKVYETGKFTFYFANLKQTVDSMTSIDTSKISHDGGIEVSGFLGAPVLRLLSVHIDYRDNLMKFVYAPLK